MPYRPGTTPEGRRSAPKPSLRSPIFRWTLFEGRPYPPDSFSGLLGAPDCPDRAPQIPSERRSLLTDWSRYHVRGWRGGAFPRSPLDPQPVMDTLYHPIYSDPGGPGQSLRHNRLRF